MYKLRSNQLKNYLFVHVAYIQDNINSVIKTLFKDNIDCCIIILRYLVWVSSFFPDWAIKITVGLVSKEMYKYVGLIVITKA